MKTQPSETKPFHPRSRWTTNYLVKQALVVLILLLSWMVIVLAIGFYQSSM